MGKMSIFDLQAAVSLKWCKIRSKLLLVCNHIRVVPIFVGFAGYGASKTGSSKIAIFASCVRYTCIFPQFIYETKIIRLSLRM